MHDTETRRVWDTCDVAMSTAAEEEAVKFEAAGAAEGGLFSAP